MASVANIANSIISIYLLLLFIRILLTWFGGIQTMGKPAEILAAITDPYLNLFRGLRFLRIGHLDFSPIAAIMLLSLISSILTRLQMQQSVTIGLVLAIVVMMIISTLRFFAFILLIMCVIRLVTLIASIGIGTHFTNVLDTMLQPLCSQIIRRFFPRRIIPYSSCLFMLTALLVIIYFGSQYLGIFLAQLLQQLPF